MSLLYCHAMLMFFGASLQPARSATPTQENKTPTLEERIEPTIRVQAWHVSGTADATTIELPRVRFGLSGSPLPGIDYKLQLAFEDDLELKDAEGAIHILPGLARLSIGRRKLPTYREFVTSSGKLALVERSILHDAFDGERGVGIALEEERVEGSGWSYSLGAWSDEMDRRSFEARALERAASADGFLLAVGGRLSYGSGLDERFDQLDLEGGGLRWDVGVSANHSIASGASAAPGRSREALDYKLAIRHLSVIGDVHLAQTHMGAPVNDGFGIQNTVSYVWMERLALAARGALLLSRDRPTRYEATMGSSILSPRRGHRLKLVADTSLLTGGQLRARVMLQLAL